MHSFSCDWWKTEYVVFFLSLAKELLILWITHLSTSHNTLLHLSYTGPSSSTQQSYCMSKDALACCAMHCRPHLCYKIYVPSQKISKGESQERNQEIYICIQLLVWLILSANKQEEKYKVWVFINSTSKAWLSLNAFAQSPFSS